MSCWHGFKDVVEREVPLAPRTSFHIGGPAECLARPRSVEELAALLARAKAADCMVRILGNGTNLLVADAGVRGLVVELAAPAFGSVEVEGKRVRVGAGARLSAVVTAACEAGLGGIETLAGIPGTLGGALRMNAGGREHALGGAIEELEVLESDGSIQTLSAAEAGFAYRASGLDGRVVLGATLRLEPDDPSALAGQRREALETKRAAQPLEAWSAGCVFRNPSPDTPAGQLIEKAGLKGRAVGGARVSEKHANFIVNEGNATSADVRALIDRIRKAVEKVHGIALELEIEVWE